MFVEYLFYFFSAITLLAATMVIVSKNPVSSVLYLVLTFVATAFLWMLIEAEFLAVALVLVYVGAVLVLFMFVVMMLDIEVAELRAKFIKYLPVGVCVSILLLIFLVFALGPTSELIQGKVIASQDIGYNNAEFLGEELFSKYLLEIEIAGIILLAAMVASISLTFRGKRVRKGQSVHEQVRVRKQDRLKIIDMPSENRQRG